MATQLTITREGLVLMKYIVGSTYNLKGSLHKVTDIIFDNDFFNSTNVLRWAVYLSDGHSKFLWKHLYDVITIEFKIDFE